MPRKLRSRSNNSFNRHKSKHPRGRFDPLRLSVEVHEIVIWFEFPDGRRKRIGTVNRHLATDASRHGQDLVGELVERALQEADRQESLCIIVRDGV